MGGWVVWMRRQQLLGQASEQQVVRPAQKQASVSLLNAGHDGMRKCVMRQAMADMQCCQDMQAVKVSSGAHR